MLRFRLRLAARRAGVKIEGLQVGGSEGTGSSSAERPGQPSRQRGVGGGASLEGLSGLGRSAGSESRSSGEAAAAGAIDDAWGL